MCFIGFWVKKKSSKAKAVFLCVWLVGFLHSRIIFGYWHHDREWFVYLLIAFNRKLRNKPVFLSCKTNKNLAFLVQNKRNLQSECIKKCISLCVFVYQIISFGLETFSLCTPWLHHDSNEFRAKQYVFNFGIKTNRHFVFKQSINRVSIQI